MLIVNKKAFAIGLFLAVSFCGVLALIFAPIYGGGRSGLEFSDDIFNRLSKGSSNFIPALQRQSEAFRGQPFAVSIKLDPPQVETAIRVLTVAGAQVKAGEAALEIGGDLGGLMGRVLADAARMYANDGKSVSSLYDLDARQVLETWWHITRLIDKELKKAKAIEQAKLVHAVKNKAVETAYNFYSIEPERIGDEWPLVTGLLAFYVAYTLWWGFAIFYLCEGMGLTMKKAKIKKEV